MKRGEREGPTYCISQLNPLFRVALHWQKLLVVNL